MNTLVVVFRHELRRAQRDRALVWLVLIFALISAYASWSGARWAAERRVTSAQIASESDRMQKAYLAGVIGKWSSTRAPVPLTLLAIGMQQHPVLPLTDLAPLSFGQSEGYPDHAQFHALSKAHAIFETSSAALDNPAMLAAGRLDLAFVIVFLLPLFLLAGTYDLWTGERELGTSALLLAQPVRASLLIWGKALARGGVLLLTFLSILVVGLLIVAVPHGAAISGVLALAGFVALYSAFWVALAVAANIFMRHATAAALLCGTAWLSIAVLLPAAMSACTDLRRPAPSRAEYVNALRVLELELRERPRIAATAFSRSSARFDRSALARRSLARAISDDEKYAVLTNTFHAQHTERRKLAQGLRVLSPAVVVEDALERLAGTHADRAIAFQLQVQGFLAEWRRLAASDRTVEAATSAEEAYRALPQFMFRELTGRDRLVPLWSNAAALLAYNLVLISLIGFGLRRQLLIHPVTT